MSYAFANHDCNLREKMNQKICTVQYVLVWRSYQHQKSQCLDYRENDILLTKLRVRTLQIRGYTTAARIFRVIWLVPDFAPQERTNLSEKQESFSDGFNRPIYSSSIDTAPEPSFEETTITI